MPFQWVIQFWVTVVAGLLLTLLGLCDPENIYMRGSVIIAPKAVQIGGLGSADKSFIEGQVFDLGLEEEFFGNAVTRERACQKREQQQLQ